MNIIDKIQEDEDDYEWLCEFLGVNRVPYMDSFYKHYEELKVKLKEKTDHNLAIHE